MIHFEYARAQACGNPSSAGKEIWAWNMRRYSKIAYLNTNALQQLHTYFVGTLPRHYDRSVVSNTFMIDQGILEKTLEFAPGEWLLSSYIATGTGKRSYLHTSRQRRKRTRKVPKSGTRMT